MLREEIKFHQSLLTEGIANRPTCGQEVSLEVLEQIIGDKSHEIDRLSGELQNVNVQHVDLRGRKSIS
jgi:hypothetical protein